MTSAEKLRQAVDSAIVMAEVDADAVPHVVLHGWAEVFERRERVLRAIVEELGITEADVDACRSRADVQDAMRDAGDPRYAGLTNGWARLATALACLLEAAGDE